MPSSFRQHPLELLVPEEGSLRAAHCVFYDKTGQGNFLQIQAQGHMRLDDSIVEQDRGLVLFPRSDRALRGLQLKPGSKLIRAVKDSDGGYWVARNHADPASNYPFRNPQEINFREIPTKYVREFQPATIFKGVYAHHINTDRHVTIVYAIFEDFLGENRLPISIAPKQRAIQRFLS